MARKPRSPEDRREGGSRSRSHAPEPGHSGAGRTDRSSPEAPDGWRSLMSADYDYPEELDDLGGRDRRRAKKNWRRDDHAQRMAWLRDRRGAEPASPVVIVVLVVVLAIVILGLGGGLPRLLGGKGKDDGGPVSLLTPGRSVVLPTPPSSTQSAEPARPTTSDLTTPPPQTERPSSEASAVAADVVSSWARAFYTRDPSAETYAALVSKCSKWMTSEVASSFTSAGDPTYDALKNDGGKSTVLSAPVSAPPSNAEAPVDTPSRMTRFVKVTISVTGKHPQRFDVPLLVTLVNQNNQWLVSEVSGGTGP